MHRIGKAALCTGCFNSGYIIERLYLFSLYPTSPLHQNYCMKTCLRFLCIGLPLCSAVMASAQTNSVELKTGAGALLGSYNSVTAAYAAIPAALAGAYIIELTASYTGANETYPVSFTPKTGASSINTITLRPAAGVASVSMTTSVSTATSAVLILNDADYVIIDGRPGGTGTTKALTIGNTATNSNTVQLINGACFDTVRYCILQNSSTGSAGRAIHLSTSASNTTGNSDNYFSFVDIAGSRYGANSNGTAANPNTRNKFYGCNFQNVIFTGIWYQAGTAKMVVDSCKFTCTSASATTPYGVLFDSQTDSAILTKNTVYNLQASGSSAIRGFYFRTTTGTSYSLVANNFIALSAANSSSTSVVGVMYDGTTDTKAEVYYNSIRIAGALASGGTSGNVVSAAFYKDHTGASDQFILKNNIFVNERTGGTSGVQHLAMALTSTSGTFSMDYNTYTSSTGELVRSNTTVYNNIATWKAANTAPNEVHSNSKSVSFVSQTDLHLTGASLGDNELNAELIAGITTDIDNETRSAVVPYRGADENKVNPLPVRLLLFTAALKEKAVLLQWATAMETGNTGFELQRSANGREFYYIGFVAGTGNSSVRRDYHYTDQNLPAASKLYYRLKQVDKDGTVHYSAVCIIKLGGTTGFEFVAQPNPFRDKVQLSVVSQREERAVVRITDAFGKTVHMATVSLINGTSVFTPELQNMPQGLYYVQLITPRRQETIKLVKH